MATPARQDMPIPIARATPFVVLLLGCSRLGEGAATAPSPAPAVSTTRVSSARMSIRCGTTIEPGHDPLFVVDGRVMGLRADSTVDHAAAQRLLQALTPADIGSVEVLKGPAAVSLYGPGAHEGVVVITLARAAAR